MAIGSTGEPAAASTPPPTRPAAPTGRRPNPRIAQLRRTLYFLRRNTLAMIGLGILVFLILVAVGSVFYPGSYYQMTQKCGSYSGGFAQYNSTQGCICTYSSTQSAPSPGCYAVDSRYVGFVPPTVSLHPLQLGPLPLGSLSTTPSDPYFYDLASGLIKGAPWSLGISAIIVGCGASVGLLLGATAGYKGGVTEESIMRLTDIFLSIPGLLLLIVILATAGSLFPGLYGHLGIIILAFVLTDWPIYTRIVRGQVLVTREQKYVEAAKASGAKDGRILFRHIVPNSVYPVFVQMSLDVGTIPLGLAVLTFLGFHIFPNIYFPEWGTITGLSVSTQFVESILTNCELTTTGCVFPWWQIFLPGITLFLFAISVNFLSDGLRDALDPRLRR
jgi:peptide/nickel transport system permease protein